MSQIRATSWDRVVRFGLTKSDHLPYLDKSSLRNFDDVYDRLVLINLNTLLLYKLIDVTLYNEYINKNNLENKLSDIEQKLFSGSILDVSEETESLQEVECMYMLTWVLSLTGLIDYSHKLPDNLIEIIKLNTGSSYQDFKESCKLRNEHELIAELDFLYCLDWSNTDYILHNNTEKIFEYVVNKRRKTLEWVLFSDLNWDEINLDT